MSSGNAAIIIKNLSDSLSCFSKGLPIALIVIPAVLVIMTLTKNSALYFSGAFITFILGIVLHDPQYTHKGAAPAAMLGHYISFYGMALGYFSGYFLMMSMYSQKIGSLLAVFVTTLILAILLSWSLRSDSLNDVPDEMGSTLAGLCVGGFIGMLFAHFIHNLEKKKIQDDEELNTQVVCRTYQDGLLIDEQKTSPE